MQDRATRIADHSVTPPEGRTVGISRNTKRHTARVTLLVSNLVCQRTGFSHLQSILS
jgi:hypothetical protein